MPLDPKLTKFSTASPIVASYSYTDIAEGTGIQKFNILWGTTSMLTTQTLYSTSIEEYHTSTDSTLTLIATTNYDLQPFNMPKVVEGTAFYEIGTYTEGGSGFTSARIILKVQNYDGINPATTIGTATIMDVSANNTALYEIKTGTISLTRKAFKKGDILRLAVEFWGRQETGTRHIKIGRDPQNRDGTSIIPSTQDNITRSAVYIPFNIEA